MVHVQNKIHVGLYVLQFFTMRSWDFKSENFKNLYKRLSPEEKDIFNMDTEAVDTTPYLKNVILGGRQYCLKEPLSSLPRARIHLKMWVISKF